MAQQNNYYKKKRQKTKKIKEQIAEKQAPLATELSTNHRRKVIVSIVAVVIVVIMVATMIIPYIGNTTGNYRLPETALQAGTTVPEQTFDPQNITVGQTFNQVDNDYVVLFGPPTDINDLAVQIAGIPVYLVDSTAFENKSVNEGANNNNPTNPSEIRIRTDVAMIRVTNGQTASFYGTKAAVQSEIENMRQ